MNSIEKRTTIVVGLIFFCRMMGLFMILPVVSLYGLELDGASLSLLGIAVGVYGLSQALLQIPVSMLSDLYGRKRIILIGLSVFLLGSVGTLFVDSVWGLIVCRAAQGAGAIAGTSMALLADNSRVEVRTKVMAFVGISIGASFVLSLIVGPLVASAFGLQGIFIGSTLLASLALTVCYFGLQEPDTGLLSKNKRGMSLDKFLVVTRDSTLMSFSFGVFVLHLVMTASFIAIPIILESKHGIARAMHWQIYLGVFVVALLLMGPFSRASTQPEKAKRVFFGATLLMVFVLAALAVFYGSYWWMLVLFSLYFLCFNLLEALLPSLMSQRVNEEYKASAMGMFSSFQFMGAFAGGLLSGYLMEFGSIQQVLLLCAVLVGLSLIVNLSVNARLKAAPE